MDCPTCGYKMTAFETECPRCRRMTPPGYGPPPAAWPPPPSNQAPPQFYAPVGYPVQVNGGLILSLGILSFVVCNLLGPVAWVMGNQAISAIDRGQADPAQRGSANAGRICGIIDSCFFMIGIVAVLVMMIVNPSGSRQPSSVYQPTYTPPHYSAPPTYTPPTYQPPHYQQPPMPHFVPMPVPHYQPPTFPTGPRFSPLGASPP